MSEFIEMNCLYTTYRLHLSQYLTNLMHKTCFTESFISCLYMFRAHVLIIMRSKLHYTASGIITPIAGRLVHDTATYRCDVGTRGNFKLAPQWNSCISVLHTPVENK